MKLAYPICEPYFEIDSLLLTVLLASTSPHELPELVRRQVRCAPIAAEMLAFTSALSSVEVSVFIRMIHFTKITTFIVLQYGIMIQSLEAVTDAIRYSILTTVHHTFIMLAPHPLSKMLPPPM